jgi:hypothetical protein
MIPGKDSPRLYQHQIGTCNERRRKNLWKTKPQVHELRGTTSFCFAKRLFKIHPDGEGSPDEVGYGTGSSRLHYERVGISRLDHDSGRCFFNDLARLTTDANDHRTTTGRLAVGQRPEPGAEDIDAADFS